MGLEPGRRLWHFGVMSKALRRVIETVQANGGVITRSEALALGMSKGTIRRRVADGVFVDRRRGVLALPGAEDLHVLDLYAACRKLNAVVSHQSAAYLLELDRPDHIKITKTPERVVSTIHRALQD